MKFLVITGNPKKDGLCHAITEEVQRGGKDGGAEGELVSAEKLERCHVCGNGWGTCREGNACAFGTDGFNELQQKIKEADAICFVTPVYWGEMAEGLKCFLDRFRRCEFDYGSETGALFGKQVLLVASPGGSGNGMLTCLEQMDRFCRHTRAVIFDYVGINRWNNDYKRVAAYEAAKAIAGGRKAGETL